MVNHADDLSYPRCGQCHEDLVRCNDCRHHEGGACVHPRSQVHFTPDGEAAKSCPTFRSRHEARDSRIFTNLPAPLWVVALLMLVVGSLAVSIWFIDPFGRYFGGGNPLDLETQVPTQVVVNQEFTVTMRIRNLLNERSTPIYIEIPQEYMDVATPAMPLPRPRRITQSRERVVFEYAPLEAQAEYPLQLRFIQHKLGNATFVTRVYAPSSHLFREVRASISAVALELPFQGVEGEESERRNE